MTLQPETDRLPPHDLAAEVCVIGSFFLAPEQRPVIREILTADDFFRPVHGAVFKAACYIEDHPDKWGALDLVNFKNALIERGSFAKVMGKATEEEAMEYLFQLIEGVPATSNAAYYAKTVRDTAQLRRVIQAASKIVADAYATNDCAAFLPEAARAMERELRLPSDQKRPVDDEVLAGIEAAISGKRSMVPLPFPTLTRMARPTAPGTVAVLCGDPASGKSFMLSQLLLHWLDAGVRMALLPLEKNRQYHLRRAMAQLHGDPQLMREEWQAENPQLALDAHAQHKDTLERMRQSMWEVRGGTTLVWIRQWITSRAAEGYRIIAVDPITAADSGPRHWDADKEFVLHCEEVAARYGCSVLLATHPRLNKGQKPTLETLSGGMAYSRFSDVVMWLARHDPPVTSSIHAAFGPEVVEHTHHVGMFKTRDGVGIGLQVAMTFDKATLQFQEHGWIVPEK